MTARRLGLLCASTLVALLFGEVASRALGLSTTWASYGAEHELNLRDLVTPEAVGFTRPPGATWKMPRGLTFTANADGFRDRAFSNEKAEGVIRVAFLGDSVTEGYGVEELARFSNQAMRLLQQRGARFEGLNFGVVGQSTADEYLVLTRHALKFKPDVVLLQIGWNDFAQNVQKLPVLEGTAPASIVPAFPPPPPVIPGWKGFLQDHSALYLAVAERVGVLRLKRGGSNPILDRIVATPQEEWTATDRILDLFAGACRAAGAKVMVAYFPMDVEVLTSESDARFASSRIAAMAGRHGAAAVDVLTPLRHHRGEQLYLDDVHLTEAGHRVVGETIAGALARSPGSPD